MASIELSFSVLFYIICVIACILGIRILLSNPRRMLNRTFFAICMCLCVWAFGFSVSICAATPQQCEFWRRVSAIGYCIIYALVLHFSLMLTDYKTRSKSSMIYALLYIPSIICAHALSLSNDITHIEYNFVKDTIGWKNINPFTGWDVFYLVYYCGYSIMIFLTLIQWYRKSPARKTRRQALLIILSFTSAFIMATHTDIIGMTIAGIRLPQVAPVILLIPFLTTSYFIQKQSLLSSDNMEDYGSIVSKSSRRKIFDYLADSFFLIGAIYFLSQYTLKHSASLFPVLLLSSSFALIGVLIYITQRHIARKSITEIILSVVVFIFIPLVTFRFMPFAGVTVWAFPFIFILLAILFNKKTMLISVTLSSLMTQIAIMVIAPEITVQVGLQDYCVRIGILVIISWFALYVNKVYVRRLKENAEKIASQKLVSDISAACVNIQSENLEDIIESTLRMLCAFFGCRSICLGISTDSGTSAVSRNICYSTDGQQYHEDEFFQCFHNEAIRETITLYRSRDKQGDQNSQSAEYMEKHSLASLLCVPLSFSGSASGALRLEHTKAVVWSDGKIELVKIIAHLFADSLSRVFAENKIAHMAYYDYLTGLPNRSLFMDRTEQAICLAQRNEKLIGVVFLDLDTFKSINDTMGHRYGDELIVEIATHLSKSLRKSDTVARFGGDEFLIMMNNISHYSDLQKIVSNIMTIFTSPFIIQEQEIFLTASAGVAVYPQDGEDTDSLIRNADIAMYNAKDLGKNQYLFCSGVMKDDAHYRAKLTNNLYRALERHELQVYYQPQICLENNEIIGTEALLRWFHPELGLISPGIFIPLAEKSGLINSIGEWVLLEACKQNKIWQDKGLPCIRIAVNLSPNQFRNSSLVEQVSRVLKTSGLSPEYLELEITESVAVNEASYIISVLQALKNLGVRISIDDFGTEYSSLSRLKQLPIDCIKMDMQFVQGIDKSEKDKAIAKVIINLAKNLGLRVIAEGIENQAQLDFLNQKLCDEAQGFYYYKPMPASDLELILEKMSRGESICYNA
jgi:diguanylate cyclase (GGDEF)-like protein